MKYLLFTKKSTPVQLDRLESKKKPATPFALYSQNFL
jgi:hypothetical protein